MNRGLLKITLKSTRLRLPGLFLVSGLALTLFLDVLFLLFGGQYLAEQMVPPLPNNSVATECFSQHTVLCENIDYTSSYSPKEALEQWSSTIHQIENFEGEVVYWSEKCNESWLGSHYAAFHKRSEPACATMTTWSEKNSNTTHVFIQLSWSVCPQIVYKYFPQAAYFRCFEG